MYSYWINIIKSSYNLYILLLLFYFKFFSRERSIVGGSNITLENNNNNNNYTTGNNYDSQSMDSDLINTEVAVMVVVVAATVTDCNAWSGGGVLGWQGGEVMTDTGLHLLFINGKLLGPLLCSSSTLPPPLSSRLIMAQSSTTTGSFLFICLFCKTKNNQTSKTVE